MRPCSTRATTSTSTARLPPSARRSTATAPCSWRSARQRRSCCARRSATASIASSSPTWSGSAATRRGSSPPGASSSATRAPARCVGVGEPVWPGRSDAELVECSRHESLLNLAFDGLRPWQLLCPYDAAALDPAVLDERAPHPPARGREQHPLRQRALRPAAGGDGVGRAAAAAVRRARRARLHSARPRARADFAAGAHAPPALTRTAPPISCWRSTSSATNSMRHGGGHGVLRIWEEDGRSSSRSATAGGSTTRWPAASGPSDGRWRRPRAVDGQPAVRPRPGCALRRRVTSRGLHMSLGSVVAAG